MFNSMRSASKRANKLLLLSWRRRATQHRGRRGERKIFSNSRRTGRTARFHGHGVGNTPFDHRDLHGIVQNEARDHRITKYRERLPPRQGHQSFETHKCQDGAHDCIRSEGRHEGHAWQGGPEPAAFPRGHDGEYGKVEEHKKADGVEGVVIGCQTESRPADPQHEKRFSNHRDAEYDGHDDEASNVPRLRILGWPNIVGGKGYAEFVFRTIPWKLAKDPAPSNRSGRWPCLHVAAPDIDDARPRLFCDPRIGLVDAFVAAIAFVRFRTIEQGLFPFAITLKTTSIVAIAPLLVLWLGTG
jgi:hypothetical protein